MSRVRVSIVDLKHSIESGWDASATIMIPSAESASSIVEEKASIKRGGRSLIKPTVSERVICFPEGRVASLVVVEKYGFCWEVYRAI